MSHVRGHLGGRQLLAHRVDLRVGRLGCVTVRGRVVDGAHVDRDLDLVVPLRLHLGHLHLGQARDAHEKEGHEGHEDDGDAHRAVTRQALADLGQNKTKLH